MIQNLDEEEVSSFDSAVQDVLDVKIEISEEADKTEDLTNLLGSCDETFD